MNIFKTYFFFQSCTILILNLLHGDQLLKYVHLFKIWTFLIHGQFLNPDLLLDEQLLKHELFYPAYNI
jgi:hypothetical protein